jgi:hypothetical protein
MIWLADEPLDLVKIAVTKKESSRQIPGRKVHEETVKVMREPTERELEHYAKAQKQYQGGPSASKPPPPPPLPADLDVQREESVTIDIKLDFHGVFRALFAGQVFACRAMKPLIAEVKMTAASMIAGRTELWAKATHHGNLECIEVVADWTCMVDAGHRRQSFDLVRLYRVLDLDDEGRPVRRPDKEWSIGWAAAECQRLVRDWQNNGGNPAPIRKLSTSNVEPWTEAHEALVRQERKLEAARRAWAATKDRRDDRADKALTPLEAARSALALRRDLLVERIELAKRIQDDLLADLSTLPSLDDDLPPEADQ